MAAARDVDYVPGTPSDSEDESLMTSTPMMARKNSKIDFDVSSISDIGGENRHTKPVETSESGSESDDSVSFVMARKPAVIDVSSDEEGMVTVIGTPSSASEKSGSLGSLVQSVAGANSTAYQSARTDTADSSKKSSINSGTAGSRKSSTAVSSSSVDIFDRNQSQETIRIDDLSKVMGNMDLARNAAAPQGQDDILDVLVDSLREVNLDNNQRRDIIESPSSSPEFLETVQREPTRPQLPSTSRQHNGVPQPAQRKMVFLDKLPESHMKDAGAKATQDTAKGVPEHLRGSVEKVLFKLQKIIASVPKDDGHDELGKPELLKTDLYKHQKYGLKWLWWREAEKPYGGILADEMGLGKTVMILALICRGKWENKENKSGGPTHWHSKEHERLVPSKATLVVCPPSVLGQWEQEIKKKSSGLKVLVYHGPSRPRSSAVLAQNDVVLTTYNILGSEIPKLSEQTAEACRSPVIRVGWLRVVLDEGHVIRNPKTTGAQAICRISAHHRWVVTGTPVHNKPSDMFSLVKFLRLAPFDDPQVWESWIGMKSVGKQQAERLNTVAKCLLLRRTKDEVMNDKVADDLTMEDIPKKTIVDVHVKLKPDELAVYDHLDSFATAEFRLFLKEKEKRHNELQRAADQFVAGRPKQRAPTAEERSFTHIFTLILRLRQCAVLPFLIQGMIEDDEDLEDSSEFDPLGEIVTMKNPVFREEYKSAKVDKLLEDIDDLKQQCRARGERMEKVVIVSQWTSLLKIVDMHIRAKGYQTTTISGEVKISDRTDIMMRFNTDPKRPQIMLLSLSAGGVGLNLTGANHLFFLDIHWNPQLELQAQDRIHRFGQKKPVTIRRYISEGTIEHKILELQQQKLQLADGILNTAQKKNGTGLNIAEMRQLFGV